MYTPCLSVMVFPPTRAELLQHVPSAVPVGPGITAVYKRTSLAFNEYSWFMNIHWIGVFMTRPPDSQLESLERDYWIVMKYQMISKQLRLLGFNSYVKDRYIAPNLKVCSLCWWELCARTLERNKCFIWATNIASDYLFNRFTQCDPSAFPWCITRRG